MHCPMSLRFRSASTLFVVIAILPWLSLAQAQYLIGGDVGPSFTESSAAVFAGALQMATVEPSSGILRSRIPLDYPVARGGAQPTIGLYYSSASGMQEAGMGWSLGLPAIERRGLGGGPPESWDDPRPEAPVKEKDKYGNC